MNIGQLHERVRFWLDRVATARFEPSDIDIAINIATEDIIEEKYSGSKLLPGDSFQKTQKLRDELSKLVKTATPTMTITTNTVMLLTANMPSSFSHLLAIALTDSDSVEHNCWPQSYDRINVNEKSPYRRKRTAPFAKVYYNELSTGIKITHAFTSNPTLATIYYLSTPVAWSYGNEYTSTKSFTVADIIIAVSDTVIYNGVTYHVGDAITIVTGHLTITSGTVIFDYIASDINEQLHEAIGRRAAINALLTIGETAKATELVKFFD